MITVAGEALMDVVLDSDGAVTAFPGGAPFNVARAIARLGGECQFLGRFARDRFGCRLRRELEQLEIRLAVPEATAAPTTLAIAELDDAGVARYRFYLDNTSAAQLGRDAIPPGLLADSDAVIFGGLGIVLEPIASTLRALIGTAPVGLMVMLDLNCRPDAIADLDSYRGSVAELLAHVDVVKVSIEDLLLLDPGEAPHATARLMLEHGAEAVLVTEGPAPVRILTARGERLVPVPAVRVVDTVGAGDAFVAAFVLAWLARPGRLSGCSDLDELARATALAANVATAACSVAGANLPDDLVWPHPRLAGAARSDPADLVEPQPAGTSGGLP